MRAQGSVDRGLQDIPLDAIVGSVNRYTDFTRTFLPRKDEDAQRWARVDLAVTGLEGLEPIEVYQIGDAYFVVDGNHRVSVARWLGADHIAAHVVEVRTMLPFSPTDSPDDLILKARLAEFMEKTALDECASVVDFTMTAPGRYRILLEDIAISQHMLTQERSAPVSLVETARVWYEDRYLPVCEIIAERGLLYHFSDRTVTDLFAWVVEHQRDLTDELQWHIDAEAAAADLRELVGADDAVATDREQDRLIRHILVPINNSLASRNAAAQAITIAQRSGSTLYALHVVVDESDDAKFLTEECRTWFAAMCHDTGVTHEFAVETGSVAQAICDRARWVDLVVTGVTTPPEDQPASRLTSGFGAVVRRCSRPILAVPPGPSSLSRALLAYDGSRKSREALSLATYLSGQWSMPLVVLTVADAQEEAEFHLDAAQAYLSAHDVDAHFVAAGGETAETILTVAHSAAVDLIIMGGYSRSTLVEVALGSSVDRVVQALRYPVLICR